MKKYYRYSELEKHYKHKALEEAGAHFIKSYWSDSNLKTVTLEHFKNSMENFLLDGENDFYYLYDGTYSHTTDDHENQIIKDKEFSS